MRDGDVAGICLDCGLSHDRERRWKTLRRHLPASTAEIALAHPCWWGGGKNSAGAAMLIRDLHAIGTVKERGGHDWRLP